MTPSDEQRPLECDCLQQSGHIYTPHSPKCSSDNIAALAVNRDRLTQRLKGMEEVLREAQGNIVNRYGEGSTNNLDRDLLERIKQALEGGVLTPRPS